MCSCLFPVGIAILVIVKLQQLSFAYFGAGRLGKKKKIHHISAGSILVFRKEEHRCDQQELPLCASQPAASSFSSDTIHI